MGLERFSSVIAPILATVVACGGANHERKSERPEPTVADLSRSVAEAARCISNGDIGGGRLVVDETSGAVRCSNASGYSGEGALSVDPTAVGACMAVQNSSDPEFVDCVVKASVVAIQQDVCASVSNDDRETLKVCNDVAYARDRLAQGLVRTTQGMDRDVGKVAGHFEERLKVTKARIATLSDREIMEITGRRYRCDDKGEIRARVRACEWAELEARSITLGLNNALSRLLDIDRRGEK